MASMENTQRRGSRGLEPSGTDLTGPAQSCPKESSPFQESSGEGRAPGEELHRYTQHVNYTRASWSKRSEITRSHPYESGFETEPPPRANLLESPRPGVEGTLRSTVLGKAGPEGVLSEYRPELSRSLHTGLACHNRGRLAAAQLRQASDTLGCVGKGGLGDGRLWAGGSAAPTVSPGGTRTVNPALPSFSLVFTSASLCWPGSRLCRGLSCHVCGSPSGPAPETLREPSRRRQDGPKARGRAWAYRFCTDTSGLELCGECGTQADL